MCWLRMDFRIGKAIIQIIMFYYQIIWGLDNWLVRHINQQGVLGKTKKWFQLI